MQPPKMSEAEARDAHKVRLLRAGQHRGTVAELTEGISAKGNETWRAVVATTGPEGTEYRLIDVMSATKLGALKLRHFCRACGCEDQYDAGHIEPSMCLGREVVATVQIKREKGFAPRAVISDYAPVAASSVVPLRSAG